jgi:hypothetical protein
MANPIAALALFRELEQMHGDLGRRRRGRRSAAAPVESPAPRTSPGQAPRPAPARPAAGWPRYASDAARGADWAP